MAANSRNFASIQGKPWRSTSRTAMRKAPFSVSFFSQ